ncbi:MAG: hypothetical protein RR842_14855, partial [Gordonibacter sp.]
EQPTLYDGIGKTDPMLRVQMACAWVARDYGKVTSRWMRLVRLCERAYGNGEVCIRRGDLYRIAQEVGLDITVSREFRFDNNLWAPLSRYMLMFRPKLARVIFPKTCDLDRAGIDFERVWHDTVHAQTFFPASTWQEAVEACKAQDVSAA